MPVPNTFGTATSAIPLSQLDANFATPITIGNTAVQLGNTVTTLNNMTLANVTISSGTITITNVAVTTANVSGTANISTLVVVGNETVGGNTSVTGNTTVAGSVVLSGGTANGVAYLNTSKQLTTGSALVFDGTNLGVGITPTTALHVSSASNTFATVGSTNGAAYWQMIGNNATNASYNSLISKYGATTDWSISGGNGTTGQMLFNIGSTEGFRLNSTSLYTASTINVGIGTSSPTAKLTVSGNQSFVEKTAAYLGVDVATSAGNGGNLTVKAGAGNGAGNTAGTLYLGAGRGNASASNGSIVFGIAQATNTVGLDSTLMTLDASGNLLVGTTSTIISTSRRLQVEGPVAAVFKGTNSGSEVMNIWQAVSTGDNVFIEFDTDTTIATRGSISYNRTAGLVAYNTTSDYRAKDIYGSIADSGTVIDSTPVYMGKMKGATQERPMFLAHEVPAYAHTGEKDAVDADGKPVYQQMDASSLIPVMWAEIQSLRKRLAAANL